jgi:hypothetical protein
MLWFLFLFEKAVSESREQKPISNQQSAISNQQVRTFSGNYTLLTQGADLLFMLTQKFGKHLIGMLAQTCYPVAGTGGVVGKL